MTSIKMQTDQANKSKNRLAKYRTRNGAKRYAADLRIMHPSMFFAVDQHPYDFGFTVARMTSHGARMAYCLARPTKNA